MIYCDHSLFDHPAIITSIESMELNMVNLSVFVDGGGNKWVKGVTLASEKSPNTWRWPPRQ